MKPFNKEEYNKLCAEFLGYVNTTPNDKDFNIHEHPLTKKMIETNYCNYFTDDWNWIMEVVEKIEEIYYLKPVHILGNQCNILTNKTFKVCRDSKKEAVVQAIWEFLNWYKENK